MEELEEALPTHRRATIGELIENQDFRFNLPRMIIQGELADDEIFRLLAEGTGAVPIIVATIRYFKEQGTYDGYFPHLVTILWNKDDGEAFSELIDVAEDIREEVLIIIEPLIREGAYSWKCLDRLLHMGITLEQMVELFSIVIESHSEHDEANLKIFKFMISNI
jgi:hypothetical protein